MLLLGAEDLKSTRTSSRVTEGGEREGGRWGGKGRSYRSEPSHLALIRDSSRRGITYFAPVHHRGWSPAGKSRLAGDNR